MPAHSPQPRALAWLAVAGVVLLSINLRPGATSVGPVLAEMQAELGMSGTTAGLLTALPGLCFALFGALAVRTAFRLTVTGAIAWGTLLIAVGLVGRSLVGDTAPFLVLTVVAFVGMALGNVLVPSFIKRHFPRRSAVITAAYTTGLAGGATLAALVAAPIAAVAPGGWRASVGIWGVIAAAALAAWMPLAVLERRRHRATGHVPVRAEPLWTMARSPKAVALAVFFGTQSMQAYIQFGWAAQIYRDAGVSQADAGVLAAVISGCGIPGGLVAPLLVARMRDPRVLGVLYGAVLAAGYLGLLLAPTALPLLWAFLLGISGAAFPTSIALITARTRSPLITARLSGFAQSAGYLLAALGPFAVGVLRDVTGGWRAPLLVLTGTAVVLGVSGWIAAGPGAVDDELSP